MNNILPSKRVIPLVILLMIVLGGVSLFVLNKQKPVDFTETLALAEANYTTQDSDNDELLDWEEDLWGTDPYNADTDTDGTKDGEEVKNNRHPRVAGPDDAINSEYKQNLYDTYVSAGLVTDNSPNSVLENEIYPKILTITAKKMDGQEITENDLSEIFSPLSDDANATIVFYTLSDIHPSQDVDIPQYVDSIIRTLASYGVEEINLGSPLTIIAEHLSNQDSKTNLSNHIRLYTEVTVKLLALSIPEDQAEEHLELVNSYATIASSLKQIEKDGYNPLTTFVHTSRYKNADARIKDMLYTLGKEYSITQ